jgi:hypothetical protein
MTKIPPPKQLALVKLSETEIAEVLKQYVESENDELRPYPLMRNIEGDVVQLREKSVFPGMHAFTQASCNNEPEQEDNSK